MERMLGFGWEENCVCMGGYMCVGVRGRIYMLRGILASRPSLSMGLTGWAEKKKRAGKW